MPFLSFCIVWEMEAGRKSLLCLCLSCSLFDLSVKAAVRFNVTSVVVMRTLFLQGLLVVLKNRSIVIKIVSTLQRLEIPYGYMCGFKLLRWCFLCMKLVLDTSPGVWVKISELRTVLDCFAKLWGKKSVFFSWIATDGESDAQNCWVFVVVVVSLVFFFLFFFSDICGVYV